MEPVEPRVPYPPNAAIEAIDAQLAELAAKRLQMVGNSVIMPSTAAIDQWAAQFGVPSAALRRIFWSLRLASLVPEALFARRTDDPLGVLPIMRRVTWATFHFTVTHAVQYPDSSVVNTVLIDHAAGEAADGDSPLDVQIALAIESSDQVFAVHQEEQQGRAPVVQQAWRVEPRLPDTVEAVTFMLVPGEPRWPQWRPKVVTVPQPLTVE
ncbi:MAG: hypothetical protein OWU84_03495 [Firmicutes bacterium]|nr:hypothetical protein [Bacillota bacterium]